MQFVLHTLLSFCLLSLSLQLFAADYNFEPVADPLLARQSSVYQISADQQGLLWFASDTDGLLRYSGYRSQNWLDADSKVYNRRNINRFIFTPQGDMWLGSWGQGLLYLPNKSAEVIEYKSTPSEADSLASDRVQEIFQDSQQRIWIGSVAGVNVIYPNAPKTLRRFAHSDPKHPLYQQRIWYITEFADALWFATSNGIVRLSMDLSDYQHLYLPGSGPAAEGRVNEVRNIATYHNRLWASSELGVFYFEQSCTCFKQVPLPADMSTPRVNLVYPFSDNKMWVGSSDGLFQFDLTTFNWTQHAGSYNFLPNVDVRSLYQNSSKKLWVGSRDQGIFIGNLQHQGFLELALTMPATLEDAGRRLVTAVHHDKTDNLWLATPNMLLKRDVNQQWHSIEVAWQYNIRKIYDIKHSRDNQLWLATDVGLFKVLENSLQQVDTPFNLANLETLPITTLHIDSTDTFYLGVWQKGLLVWQPTLQHAELQLSEIASNHGNTVFDLNLSQANFAYAATRYSGLFQKTAQGNSWQPLQLDFDKSVEGFNCVLPEGEQLLWLCSEYGLWQVNLQNGKIMQFLPEQGLPSPFITSAFFDHKQQLWALTNNGPARYSNKLQRFISFGIADGLPDLTMQRNAFSQSSNGEIVLGTANGAAILQNANDQEIYTEPTLTFTSIRIDGEDKTRELGVNFTQLQLPFDHDELVIRFAVIDFWEPALNRARSRLLGLSDRWSVMDTGRELRFSNLAPGTYTLEVEGQNSRGIPTKQALRLQIKVAAPWWYSAWVWGAALLTLTFTILLIVRLREANLRKQNMRLQALVKQRTQELESLTVQLKNRADHDPLTGLLNRDGFAEHFSRLLSHASRHQHPVSLVLVDIDFFKLLNDQYGHSAGDQVLQYFSALLKNRIRGTDIIGRWGGEEFVIALANSDAQNAKAFCDNLLQQLSESGYCYEETQLTISATFGIAALPLEIRALEDWIKLADQALYQGKNNGRGQAVIADAGQETTLADNT